MRRGETGRYEVTNAGGEQVRAFIPSPLPPSPELTLNSGGLQSLLESAVLAVGRLDGISTLLPDQSLFLYAYVRKEAVLSSQIEGAQSSLSDLLLFELEQAPGAPIDDVVEVSNYVAALDHGSSRLREGFPLSNRLIREIHGVLLARGRGNTKSPGEFRTSQNWIGGIGPGTRCSFRRLTRRYRIAWVRSRASYMRRTMGCLCCYAQHSPTCNLRLSTHSSTATDVWAGS